MEEGAVLERMHLVSDGILSCGTMNRFLLNPTLNGQVDDFLIDSQGRLKYGIKILTIRDYCVDFFDSDDVSALICNPHVTGVEEMRSTGREMIFKI